ncbi:hypothetical protein BDA96_09G202700, partial [Sorghum bicolor]
GAGPTGRVLGSWDPSGDPCAGSFVGVTCSRDGRVTAVSLQGRGLSGTLPPAVAGLRRLQGLYLHYNGIKGPYRGRLGSLLIFDVRNNTLSGSVPVGLRRLNGGFQYMNNKGLCGADFSLLELCSSSEDGLKPSKPEPFGPDGTVKTRQVPQSANPDNCSGSGCSKSANASEGVLIVAVVAVVIGAAFCGLFAFSWYRRQKQKIGSSLEVSDSRLSTDHFQQKEACRRSASPLISVEYSNSWDPLSGGAGVGSSGEVGDSFRFNLEEVECATQYFSDVNLLGKSGFAATYKGILRDGSVVAVKSLNKTSCKQEESDFLRGLKMLTLLQHDNLGERECFLVYDFMVNGCLSQYLDVKDGSSATVLDWPTRVSIIRGIAKGIEYLHSKKSSKPPVVHQNISAEKILLDHHFAPRLSVPGLHKLLADDVIFSTLKASAAMGYLAPEYATTGRFTDKSD